MSSTYCSSKHPKQAWTNPVCNKCDDIADYVTNLDLDVLVITEPWLTGKDSDHRINGDLTTDGYTVRHAPPTHRKGGGVGILYRDSFKTQHHPKYQARSFENYQLTLASGGKRVRVAVI